MLPSLKVDSKSIKSIEYETTKYYQTTYDGGKEKVKEITKDQALTLKALNKNMFNLEKKYKNYKNNEIEQIDLIEEMNVTLMSIGPGFYFDDDGDGGSTNNLLVNFDPNNPLTEVQIDQLYNRIIAYSQYKDYELSKLTTYISFDPESNTNLLLRATYVVYSQFYNRTYRDFMAIGFPDYLIPRETTIKWKKSLDYSDGINQKNYSVYGDTYDLMHDDTMEITAFGILWNIKPFASYANYGYNTIGGIPIIKDDGYMESDVELITATYILETYCITEDATRIYDDFNPVFWSDYQHTIEKISASLNLNIRAYIGVSKNIGFLGVNISQTLNR